MGKNKTEMTADFDNGMVEITERSGRSGWLVTLLVLSLIGAVVWFVMSRD